MRSTSSWLCLFSLPMISAAVGCSRLPVATPSVTYEPSQPSGDWSNYGAAGVESAGGAAGIAQHYGIAGSAAGGSIARSGGGAGAGAAGSGGRGAAGAMAGRGGSASASAAGSGGASPAAGSGGSVSAGSGGSAATPTTMMFAVTTSPAGYLYQPRNIGAIWVQDSSGRLVKSLEVWAGVRKRYLTRYASALNGSAIDVTASATLPYHRTHQVAWNLQDKTGAAVAPGKYTLVMELTDGDQTGPSNTVAFDTSAGPSTISPANAPSFGAMKLQLQ